MIALGTLMPTISHRAPLSSPSAFVGITAWSCPAHYATEEDFVHSHVQGTAPPFRIPDPPTTPASLCQTTSMCASPPNAPSSDLCAF